MRFEIVGKHGFVATEAIKDYVEKKMLKLLNFFEDGAIESARIVLSTYKHFTKVEVTIPSPYIILRSEVKDPDMYAAIDKSIDKLSQQIRKHKTKVRNRLESGGKVPVFNETFNNEPDVEHSVETKASNLVKNKKITIKPMSEDDAIAQMELSGHDFFIYLDIQTFSPKIVYRRDDGDYAVIDTKPE